jgi:hypothetical protein
LKKGLNPISIGHLTFKGKHVGIAVKAGVLSGFLALAVRTFNFSESPFYIIFLEYAYFLPENNRSVNDIRKA